jgi:hypothetical protein
MRHQWLRPFGPSDSVLSVASCSRITRPAFWAREIRWKDDLVPSGADHLFSRGAIRGAAQDAECDALSRFSAQMGDHSVERLLIQRDRLPIRASHFDEPVAGLQSSAGGSAVRQRPSNIRIAVGEPAVRITALAGNHREMERCQELGGAARVESGDPRRGPEPPAVTERRPPPHCIECSPIRFPSVSSTKQMNPWGPMENFGRWIWPPFFAARAASTAQSAHEK